MHSEASDETMRSDTSRAAAPGTGVPEVDEVLASLEGLEGSPPAEHVAVFEQAHDRLRRALDTDPGEPAAASPPQPESQPESQPEPQAESEPQSEPQSQPQSQDPSADQDG